MVVSILCVFKLAHFSLPLSFLPLCSLSAPPLPPSSLQPSLNNLQYLHLQVSCSHHRRTYCNVCREPLHVVAKWHYLRENCTKATFLESRREWIRRYNAHMHAHTRTHRRQCYSVEFESYCINLGLIYVNNFKFLKDFQNLMRMNCMRRCKTYSSQFILLAFNFHSLPRGLRLRASLATQ